jgi:hypothetical protein
MKISDDQCFTDLLVNEKGREICSRDTVILRRGRENVLMNWRLGREVVRKDLFHIGLMAIQLQKAFCAILHTSFVKVTVRILK